MRNLVTEGELMTFILGVLVGFVIGTIMFCIIYEV